jgi:hypothetical protein
LIKNQYIFNNKLIRVKNKGKKHKKEQKEKKKTKGLNLKSGK